MELTRQIVLAGTAASPGTGMGRAVFIVEKSHAVARCKANPKTEEQRYRKAVKAFCSQMESAGGRLALRAGEKEAEILLAQTAFANDPELERQVLSMIREEHVNAEYAFSNACEQFIALFSSMEDELLRARAADFRDLRDQVVGILTGQRPPDLSGVAPGSILVAEDILPSQSAGIDPEKVRGIVTRGGTKFSHIAIIARALGIPTVVGVEAALDEIVQGQQVIVDGDNGKVLVAPEKTQVERYQCHIQAVELEKGALGRYRSGPAVTTDGITIMVAANLAMEQELSAILESGADGIGLLRTEFLYMDSLAPPDEEQQYRCYKEILQAMEDKPVIIRTLDVGGDKEIPSLGLAKEANPFLGNRAIRFCLENPELFRTQLAAVLRAGVYGNAHLLLPMVTTLEELHRTKALLEEVKVELRLRGVPFAPGVPVGIMVETPAAALRADSLAREADFFSIGTNDLTQYTLAVDRGNRNVEKLFDSLHPAVLSLVSMTGKAASKRGISVGVCGEAAADPRMIPLLLGAGVTELSVAPGSVGAVKKQVCALSRGGCAKLLEKVLADAATPKEVERCLTDAKSL